MRIVVCMKQVHDPKTVRISRSREEFDLRGATAITNLPDKHALEAALRLREVAGGEVVAVTVGDAGAEDVVREAVAMGADRALLVTAATDAQAGGRGVARIIAAAVRWLGDVGLVLTGQAGLVDGAGSLAPRLAAELSWPVLLDAANLVAQGGGVQATVRRGDGVILAPLPFPAVASVQPIPERPRYPQPARIANAWADGLVMFLTVDDLNLAADALAPDVECGGLVLPPERTRGQMIAGSAPEAARQLAGILRTKRIL